METACRNGKLDWGVATRAFPGEEVAGDNHFVTPTAKGWLLAVADGLGHGPEAAVASTALLAVLQRHIEKTPVELILLCHEALKNTRGSAASVVTIDSARCLVSWAGVGNVEGVIHHAHSDAPSTEYINTRGGIVGYRIPALQPSFLRLLDGDVLVLATDGIDSDFIQDIGAPYPPDKLADYLLEHYAKLTDDALILVARWRLPSTPQGGNPS